MNVNTQPEQDMGDEELDEFNPLPEAGEMEAIFAAIKPVMRQVRLKRRVKKAVKRVTAVACILLLASLAIQQTMQPTALPVKDAVSQLRTAMPQATERFPTLTTRPPVAAISFPAVHRKPAASRRKELKSFYAQNTLRTEKSIVPVSSTVAVRAIEQIPLPTNSEPVTGTRLFTAGPGEPIVTLAAPKK